MLKPFHSFEKNKQTEIDSTYLHDKVYEQHVQKINQEYNTDFKVRIDRDSCNYDTSIGKEYQKSDTDAILLLHCDKTGKRGVRKVSEKTRTKYYDDIYIEIISILKWNEKTKKYQIESPGWGLKNDQLSPDCLSLLFLNDKQKTYYSIFIDKYKKLKNSLFGEVFYNNMKNGKIEAWLNRLIELDINKGRKGFRHVINKEKKHRVKEVIFARNKNYITVGFTFSLSHIKSLVHVDEYNGKIVDQNTKTMQY